MSTVPAETNLTTVPAPPEIQSPDAGEQKRSMALARTQQFLATVAEIKDGRVIGLKIAVNTPERYAQAGDLLIRVKDYRDDLEATFRPELTRRFNFHRELSAKFNSGDTPAEQVQKLLGNARTQFAQEAERARLAEQRRLQAIADAQAQEEERKRQEEYRLNAAIEAEQMGNVALAEEIISAPAEPVQQVWSAPVIVESSLPQTEGLTESNRWKGWVIGEEGSAEYDANFLLLVKDVASGKVPLTVLKVNQAGLNTYAVAMKRRFNASGCKADPVTTPRRG
ncbi:MAG TPA: hypothetical protein VGP89_18210 [Candidatus Angelobacter sp.]|jgi:hypothetical protein|nr:hypothetical protein [Candidatus Angelobacter sp.]